MAWTRRGRLWAVLAVVPLLAGVWWSGWRFTADPRTLHLEVDLSRRELAVVQRGDIITIYSIAVGSRRHPTPTGTYWTGDIVWNPSWRPPDVPWARRYKYQPPGAPANPMRGVKIYFLAPDYFIHGTNDPDSMGEAASHGCIRMTEGDAVELAHRLEDAGGSVRLVITD